MTNSRNMKIMTFELSLLLSDEQFPEIFKYLQIEVWKNKQIGICLNSPRANSISVQNYDSTNRVYTRRVSEFDTEKVFNKGLWYSTKYWNRYRKNGILQMNRQYTFTKLSGTCYVGISKYISDF